LLAPGVTEPTCDGGAGQIITDTLRTDLLPLPLGYRVYLPPCYSQQPEQRFPSLYLIHGQSFNDDQWDRLGVNETVDRLSAVGKIAPMIIVMPYDRYGGLSDESNFGKVVADELLPLIDKTYRTLADRKFRAVGGLSRGAGWSVHLGLVYWSLFGALGAHSPAIFYPDAQRMRIYLDDIPPQSMPRIYIDVGERDRPEILDAAYWFEKLLDERDIPHDWYLFSGFHNEDYWQAHVEEYLLWYAQEW
jgi:enterochelin esterase-like enzyme